MERGLKVKKELRIITLCWKISGGEGFKKTTLGSEGDSWKIWNA